MDSDKILPDTTISEMLFTERIFLASIISVMIFGFLLFLPFVFGETVEKDITVVYSDENGVIDSCNNFYSHENMDDKTITEINKLSKENIQIIKVKMFIPNQDLAIFNYLTPFKNIYFNMIREVVSDSIIKSNACT